MYACLEIKADATLATISVAGMLVDDSFSSEDTLASLRGLSFPPRQRNFSWLHKKLQTRYSKLNISFITKFHWRCSYFEWL